MSVGTAEVIEYYNGMLPYMERYHKGISMGRLNVIIDTLKQIIKPGVAVLDIGCGTGITSKRIADMEAKVTAVDISPVLIEFAQKNSFSENITYIVGDIYEFSSNEKFDLIVFADVFEHLDPSKSFGIVHNLTKYNSHELTKVYLSIPDPNYLKHMKARHPDKLQIIDQGYTIEHIAGMFSYCGFEPIHARIYGIDNDVQWNEYIFLNEIGLSKYYKGEIK